MPRVLTILLLTLASGCGESDAAPPPPREVEPAVTEPERASDSLATDRSAPSFPGCDTFSRQECLASRVCTLIATGDSDTYVCRPAEGPCEVGMTGSQDSEDRCHDLGTLCLWDDGTCYCGCRDVAHTAVPDRPDVSYCDCACGGGPPPGCRAR